MELLVIPFIVCWLTIPLVYKFLTPCLSDGKVVLKPVGFPRAVLFGLSMTLGFVPVFVACAVGIALLVTPYVSAAVNAASELVMVFVSAGFRLLIAQVVFFVLTLLAGRVLKAMVTVEGRFAAWKAAWAPAIVFAVLTTVLNLVLLGIMRR